MLLLERKSIADFIFAFCEFPREEKKMLTKILEQDTGQTPITPKEGDLYKIIEVHGKTFEIRYGFYEDSDRHSSYAEPMEIYPDFVKEPQYTDCGKPFITAIQAPCESFSGERDENSSCEDCSFYKHGEELLGICTCPENQKKNE